MLEYLTRMVKCFTVVRKRFFCPILDTSTWTSS